MRRWVQKGAAPLMCGLLTFLLFQFVFFIGYVPSASMEPTIRAGSLVLGCRITGQPASGDIVIFRRSGAVLIKRIAAVPGDVVYIDDTNLTLSVNEELPGATRVLAIPEDCYFVLGDNNEHSIDSRFWRDPFVGRSQIIARMWTIRGP